MFKGSDEAAVRGKVCSKPGVGGATGCQAVREKDWGERRGGEGWSVPCGRHPGVAWWKGMIYWRMVIGHLSAR